MGSKILAQLEKIAYFSQRKYLRTRLNTELVGSHFAFFHLEDKSKRILTLYQIRLARALGKKVVLATGCFDILHQQHLQFLKKAKKEGDILVVGLEPDGRVRKMKGKGRPINSWKMRAKNLVRINEVDFVLKLPNDFGNQSARLGALQLIKPNLLALSSEDPLEKKKRKECRQIGCRLKIVHRYNPKVSTTKILEVDKKGKIL